MRIGAERRRRQFLAGRWLLRRLLAQCFGDAPAAHVLNERDGAPPGMPGAPGWHGSIAHSGDYVGAVLASCPVGLDIESAPRRRSLGALAPLLADGTDECDEHALLARWVLKEAWWKRDGRGIGEQRLRQLRLQPDSDGDLRLWDGTDLLAALALDRSIEVDSVVAPNLPPPTCWRGDLASG